MASERSTVPVAPWDLGCVEHVTKDIPDQFSRVELRIRSVTRTINAVIAEFVLTDDAAGEMERLLREPTRDRVTRERGGSILTSPAETVKGERLLEFHKQLRHHAHRWLRRQVPGVFSMKETRGTVPTAELIILDRETPFQGGQLTPASQWLRVCGLAGRPGDIWTCADPDALRAKVPYGFDDERTRHNLVLAVAWSQLFSTAKGASAKSRPTLSDTLRDVELDGLLAAWGLRSLFETWEARAALSRDLSSRRWRRWRIVRAFNGFQRYLRTVGIDVAISADEIGDLVTKQPSTFEWEFPRFVRPAGDPNAPTTLAAALRTEYADRIRQVQRMTLRLSETLETIGTVTAAAAGVRLQRRALYIGAVAVVVAVIGLLIALHTSK